MDKIHCFLCRSFGAQIHSCTILGLGCSFWGFFEENFSQQISTVKNLAYMFVDWFLTVERCGKNSLKKVHKINTLTLGYPP
jgi:hypothetical protein